MTKIDLRVVVLGLVIGLLVSIIPAGASWATAYSPWRYDLTVWVNYPAYTASLCDRAGILDTAVNLANVQSHTVNCTSPSVNVPSGYLGVNAYGYRNGAFCASTGNYYNGSTTWGFQVTWQACSNPAGSQTFRTLAYGAIYNDGSGGGAVGYSWFSQYSPNQNY